MSQAHRLYRIQSIDADQAAHSLPERPSQIARLTLHTAAQGNLEAQALLGQILLDGRGIQKDPPLALIWFKMAAAQGHAMASNMAGRCLELGWGTAIDLVQAAAYYRQAACLGLDWGQYNLANLYATGRGLTQDEYQAFQLYWQAAQQGHAKSMNLVGRYLEEGRVGPADQTAAHQWYRRSAEAGDFRGQFSLAAVLLTQERWQEAQFWFQQALNLGHLKFLRRARDELQQANLPPLQDITQAYIQRCQELEAKIQDT